MKDYLQNLKQEREILILKINDENQTIKDIERFKKELIQVDKRIEEIKHLPLEYKIDSKTTHIPGHYVDRNKDYGSDEWVSASYDTEYFFWIDGDTRTKDFNSLSEAINWLKNKSPKQ